MSLLAACHCGRVKVQLPSKPTKINECHCTVCYKYGALWAYYPRDNMVVTTAKDASLIAYIREDMEGHIEFVRCSHCGCMVCWRGLGKYAGPEHDSGVNCRLLPEEEIQDIERKISQKPNYDCASLK